MNDDNPEQEQPMFHTCGPDSPIGRWVAEQARTIAGLRIELAALRAEVEGLRGLLKDIQWSATDKAWWPMGGNGEHDEVPACPDCRGWEESPWKDGSGPVGHKPDCRIDAATGGSDV